MKKQRLLKAAAFYDELPRNKFNFDDIINRCRSVGCGMGWTPHKDLFPHLVAWDADPDNEIYLISHPHITNYITIAQKIFNISPIDAHALFSPYFYGSENHESLFELGLKKLGTEATPRQLAENIRIYVKNKNRRKK